MSTTSVESFQSVNSEERSGMIHQGRQSIDQGVNAVETVWVGKKHYMERERDFKQRSSLILDMAEGAIL